MRKNATRETAVHDLRVSVKRLRAIVHLLKEIKPAGMARLNQELGRVARSLSGARDSTVRNNWFRKHGEKPEAAPKLSAALVHRQEARLGRLRLKVKQEAKPRLADTARVVKALEASRRKTLRSRKAAKGDGAFHEWRKRSKDLLYQLEFFGIQKPKLKKLGAKLGKAQDCALVEAFLKRYPEKYPLGVLKSARREKRKLHRDALRMPLVKLKTRALRKAARLKIKHIL